MKRRSKNANKTAKRNKLQLRRETVRVLSSENLAQVAGGALYFRAGGGATVDGCYDDTSRCTSFPVHTDGC